MIVVIAKPCRPKPCHCTEHVDLGGTRVPFHPVRDSQDEVRVIFGVEEPLQKVLPTTTLDEAVRWLGHATSAEAGHFCDCKLLDTL